MYEDNDEDSDSELNITIVDFGVAIEFVEG